MVMDWMITMKPIQEHAEAFILLIVMTIVFPIIETLTQIMTVFPIT